MAAGPPAAPVWESGSVAVTTKFMDALKAGGSYDLLDPHDHAKVVGQLDARMVWDKMIEGAWRTGEPGVFFIDDTYKSTVENPMGTAGLFACDVEGGDCAGPEQDQEPLEIAPNRHNIHYLRTKRDRMGHDLPGDLDSIEGNRT